MDFDDEFARLFISMTQADGFARVDGFMMVWRWMGGASYLDKDTWP